jgi:hypothetical protein
MDGKGDPAEDERRKRDSAELIRDDDEKEEQLGCDEELEEGQLPIFIGQSMRVAFGSGAEPCIDERCDDQRGKEVTRGGS